MTENEQARVYYTMNTGQLVRVEAGAVVRDGILNVPENARGVVLLANETPEAHTRALTLAQGFYRHGIASLVVDLFSTEELRLDAETNYFHQNTEIMQQRLIGIAEWLLERPESEHYAIGYFGSGLLGTASIIAAVERPDIAVAVVVEDAQFADLGADYLRRLTTPTLLLATTDANAQTSQNALEQLTIEKQFVRLGEPENTESEGASNLVDEASTWFSKHLTWVM